ncbi:sensor histidine kinase [Bacillus sp. 1P06AnD]|uniref:sensor histidine kinase n=1 Tax=Bacillus sp. 1P06AnD TaxID=3132208 RepID=UPI0039A237BB
MRNNIRLSLTIKLFLLLLYSLLLSIATAALLLGIVYYIYKHSTIDGFVGPLIRKLYYTYGLAPAASILVVLFLFVYFMLLVRKPAKYVSQAEHVTHELSKGNFDVQIPKDLPSMPLSIFNNLELMKRQLDYLIKEEKRISHLKNDLITNVSHDLRTPLTSMIGYLQLIEEGKYKDEVELIYYADIAYEKSVRLKRMVNDLFEYTKLQNEELVLYKTEINLNELLKQLIAQFLPETTKLGICIDLDEKESILVGADADKLVRVFENIISNALKYGKAGEDILIILSGEKKQAVIEIINAGDPIPEAALPLLFNRLYRVEASRSSDTGGAGLGLAIAKGIVESHGGTIGAKSSQERTTFTVRLPLLETDKE